MCASNDTHDVVELLVPPAGCKPGDAVWFDGFRGTPDAQLAPKKKVWETVQPQFSTTAELVAVWGPDAVPFMTAHGPVKAATLANAQIK